MAWVVDLCLFNHSSPDRGTHYNFRSKNIMENKKISLYFHRDYYSMALSVSYARFFAPYVMKQIYDVI